MIGCSNFAAAQQVSRIKEEMTTPEFLYKIVSVEQWQASQFCPVIVLSSMDNDFIHLSSESQLAHVAQKFWQHIDYVVLKLASNKLNGQLVYETNPGGSNKYYHLYNGSIPLDAVVEKTLVSAQQSK